jgi:hypothetical protein
MKLEVYHSNPTKGEKDLIQVFVLNKDGVVNPTMPGDNSWANNVPGHFTPHDGEDYLKALAQKLEHSTYLVAELI